MDLLLIYAIGAVVTAVAIAAITARNDIEPDLVPMVIVVVFWPLLWLFFIGSLIGVLLKPEGRS